MTGRDNLREQQDERRNGTGPSAGRAETPKADSPAWEPLHSVTAAEFAAVDEPGASPVVGDADAILIPEGGDVIAYGDGGAGKTTLTLDLAVHLAAGEQWLDMPVPSARRVLLIENEGPRPLFRAKVRRKLGAWEGPGVANRLLISDEPWSLVLLSDEARRAEIAAMCAAREVDVLLAGPVTALGMLDAGTIAEVRAFAQLVADVRRRSGRPLTSVLVHHENKAGMVSGAWEGVCDTLLHVQAAGNGHTIVVVQKARWDSKRHGMTLKLAWRPGERFEAEGDRDYVGEIRELLSDRWLTLKEIASKDGGIGAAETTVKVALEQHPEVLEMRTGEAAKALDRLPSAKLWGLRSSQKAENADSAFQGGAEGVSASAFPLRDADTPTAPPTGMPGSAFWAQSRRDDSPTASPRPGLDAPRSEDGGYSLADAAQEQALRALGLADWEADS